jgi:general secretion pathway protein D
MNRFMRSGLWWVMVLVAVQVHAQRRPNPEGPPPGAPRGEREFRPRLPTQAAPPAAKARPQEGAATPAESEPAPSGSMAAPGQKPADDSERPSCEQVRRKARYGIYFDKVDIEKLVQTVADATCRTFILGENIRGKISIIGPENGKVEVNADQFYAAFLASLDANQLTVYPHGRFLKVVEKQRAKQTTIPTVMDPDAPYTTNEQMITKLFKVKYVDVEQLRGVLQQLVTQGGDTIPFQPDTIIINDVGSNMHRLERIIRQLDGRPSSDEVRVIQLQYATAQEISDKIQKLFESRGGGGRPGARPGSVTTPPPPPGAPPMGEPGASVGASAGGPATLTQLIPDERTNKLIIIASPAALERIENLIREIDIPISGEGRINVYYLENANAEELASTLQSLAQGTANRPKGLNVPSPPVVPGQPAVAGRAGAVSAAELFSGEVKISADKATNSLVIIASQSDYRNLIRVIERLDIPRRQVFIEAVIMEVNLDRKTNFGFDLHGGVPLAGGQSPLVFGTKFGGGALPPSMSLGSLASYAGFLTGLQGPTVLEFGGLSIPAWGVLFHAMQQSSDVNVLSTPHILTSDNEEAEITVGQNVPFQAGYAPSGLGNLLGQTSATGSNANTGTAALAALAGGGLNSLFAPITRQNVELKLTVKPQINDSNYIRMVINEQTEEIASENTQLGPTTSKRSAKTTVVARNQETIVLGGIMQDRVIESVDKVPVLGNIPILGHLFRHETKRKVKTNLLLILTPYIVNDQSDFRRILERKMKERQQFVEMFYGQVPGYEVTVDFSRKAGPFSRMSAVIERESLKAENGGPGMPGERVIRPGTTPGKGEERAPLPTETPVVEPGAPLGDSPAPAAPGGPGTSADAPPPPPPEVNPPAPGSDSPPPPPPEELRIQPGIEPELR